jgi:hypothetical protein
MQLTNYEHCTWGTWRRSTFARVTGRRARNCESHKAQDSSAGRRIARDKTCKGVGVSRISSHCKSAVAFTQTSLLNTAPTGFLRCTGLEQPRVPRVSLARRASGCAGMNNADQSWFALHGMVLTMLRQMSTGPQDSSWESRDRSRQGQVRTGRFLRSWTACPIHCNIVV